MSHCVLVVEWYARSDRKDAVPVQMVRVLRIFVNLAP